MGHPKPKARLTAARWHRRLGLAGAAFLLLLTVTGVLLNHAAQLGLDRAQIRNGEIAALYGRESPVPVGFAIEERWLAVHGEALFLDGVAVADGVAEPRGAVAAGEYLVYAGRDEIILLDREGAVVERLHGPALPGAIMRLGTAANGEVVIDTDAGSFVADADFLAWRPGDHGGEWSAPAPVPPELSERLMAQHRGPGIPASRVLLDLHSGRILGPWGPYLMDALAVVFVALIITGVINWMRVRQRR